MSPHVTYTITTPGYSWRAPHRLAAVERLNVLQASPTDTTTDTGHFEQSATEEAVLQ
jgi:hypothetical protein